MLFAKQRISKYLFFKNVYILSFCFSILLFSACKEKKVAEKKSVSSEKIAFISGNTPVKKQMSFQNDLGELAIYTPAEFAIDAGSTEAAHYDYAQGVYSLVVTDNETQESRTFESYAINTAYSTPLLPAPLLPDYSLRIRFYLEHTHLTTLKLYHSSNKKEIFSAKITGTPSPHHGPLHFAKENPDFLIHDDGTAFFGIAHNFSYEGSASKELCLPFQLDRTLRRYLPQGENNPYNQEGSHIVGNALGKFTLGRFERNGGGYIAG